MIIIVLTCATLVPHCTVCTGAICSECVDDL